MPEPKYEELERALDACNIDKLPVTKQKTSVTLSDGSSTSVDISSRLSKLQSHGALKAKMTPGLIEALARHDRTLYDPIPEGGKFWFLLRKGKSVPEGCEIAQASQPTGRPGPSRDPETDPNQGQAQSRPKQSFTEFMKDMRERLPRELAELRAARGPAGGPQAKAPATASSAPAPSPQVRASPLPASPTDESRGPEFSKFTTHVRRAGSGATPEAQGYAGYVPAYRQQPAQVPGSYQPQQVPQYQIAAAANMEMTTDASRRSRPPSWSEGAWTPQSQQQQGQGRPRTPPPGR